MRAARAVWALVALVLVGLVGWLGYGWYQARELAAGVATKKKKKKESSTSPIGELIKDAGGATGEIAADILALYGVK